MNNQYTEQDLFDFTEFMKAFHYCWTNDDGEIYTLPGTNKEYTKQDIIQLFNNRKK